MLLKKLIDVLYSNNCLHDFMLLIQQIANKSIPVTNIAFLLCLERAKWQSLASTVPMRFRTIAKKIWSVVYRLLKGKWIQFFSGTKNWGHIISKMSKRGQMNPKDSEINFAVPNEWYLHDTDRNMGKIIPPGIITKSCEILQNKQNIMILGDIKRISRGLGWNRYGDVNLWGFEDPPSLKEKTEQTEREINFMELMLNDFNDLDDIDKFVKLKQLIKIITLRIKNVQHLQVAEGKTLEKYEKASSSPQNYESVKSAAKTYIYDCKLFVKSALSINGQICELLSSIQGSWHLLKSSTLNL